MSFYFKKDSDDITATHQCAAPQTVTGDPIGSHRQSLVVVVEVTVAAVAAGDFGADGQVDNVEDDAQSSSNDEQNADHCRLTVRVPVAVIFQLSESFQLQFAVF